MTSIVGGDRIFTRHTFLLTEVEFGCQLGVAAFTAVHLVEVEVLVAPGEGRPVEFLTVERSFACFEIVVYELIQPDVSGGPSSATEFTDVDFV